MKPRGVDFFCYTVSDISRSAEFYETYAGPHALWVDRRGVGGIRRW